MKFFYEGHIPILPTPNLNISNILNLKISDWFLFLSLPLQDPLISALHSVKVKALVQVHLPSYLPAQEDGYKKWQADRPVLWSDSIK